MKAFSWGVRKLYIHIPFAWWTLHPPVLPIVCDKKGSLGFLLLSVFKLTTLEDEAVVWQSIAATNLHVLSFSFFWLCTVRLREWAGQWRHKAISSFPLCGVQFLSSAVQHPLTLTGSQYADNLCRVKGQVPHTWGTESWDLWLFLRQPLQWKDGRNTQDVKISSGLVLRTVFLLIHMKSFFLLIHMKMMMLFFKLCGSV